MGWPNIVLITQFHAKLKKCNIHKYSRRYPSCFFFHFLFTHIVIFLEYKTYGSQLSPGKNIHRIVNSYKVKKKCRFVMAKFHKEHTSPKVLSIILSPCLTKNDLWPMWQLQHFECIQNTKKYLKVQQNMSHLVCNDSHTTSSTVQAYLQTNTRHKWYQVLFINVILYKCIKNMLTC